MEVVIMRGLFVSYSRLDRQFAVRLASALSDLGIDVWLDIEDIPAGKRWSTAIQEGLDVCDVMVVVITPESMASRNVEDEWQYFLECGKPIIPLLLKPTRVHYQLSRVHYIDFFHNDFATAFTYLHAELLHHGFSLRIDTAELRQIQPEVHVPLPARDIDEITRPGIWRSHPIRAGAYPVAFGGEDTLPIVGTYDDTRQIDLRAPAKKPPKWRYGLVLIVMLLVGGMLAYVLRPAADEPAQFDAAPVVDVTPEIVVIAEIAPTRTLEPAATATQPSIAAAPQPAPTRATIANTGAVSLREGPSTSYRRVSTAQRGEEFVVLGRNVGQTWYLVDAPNQQLLWVAANFANLDPQDAQLPVIRPIGAVTVTSASSAYESFDDQSATIAAMQTDATLPLVGRIDGDPLDWFQVIVPGGRIAWVSSEAAVARLAR